MRRGGCNVQHDSDDHQHGPDDHDVPDPEPAGVDPAPNEGIDAADQTEEPMSCAFLVEQFNENHDEQDQLSDTDKEKENGKHLGERLLGPSTYLDEHGAVERKPTQPVN